MVGNLVRKFTRVARTQGLGYALNAASRRLIHGPQPVGAPISQTGKIDFLGHWEQVLGEPHGDPSKLGTAPATRVQWVIPNFGFGSGGHLNIFRFINMLAERGFDQRLVILPPYGWSSPEAARAALEQWYFPLKAEVALGVEGFVPAAVTFATGWQTAYWVSKHRASEEKFYFVQDFEPAFHPVSSEYYFAENTYRLGLKGITAGSWLSEKLSAEYGMRCGAVSFGVEHDRYVQQPRNSTRHFNILFYSRHVTPRRLFELGLVALEKVCAECPEVAVIFAGGDVGGVKIPFPHLNAGEQKLEALPDLYSQCDLALVLSGTNLSLLPLEVSACGCPVVMNDTPSARWLLPDDAAFYAAPDPDALAQVMIEAIRNPEDRARRTAKAQEIARAATWQDQGDKVVELLASLRGGGAAG
ncbi:glycosyltransferase family 4 protein [Paracoccus sp. MBLB3053]|uniref:Glycosyltransferase family 4 protein n=1 Tax=Paracoccus aurantius TaxID=3073814 RepID=A0ABU2HVR4_9RHOB|nr:glycosyltransferase family 4 protein [Paracoccus sp. MBLB3053]MDS9469135.1 glycosyltransferase family 4 protein [Paracoccus sp. MBLB3053]